jgi:hypothetical protein
MARRSLSTQGRIVAAGVTVAVGSLLAGVMAASDHSADASARSTSAASPNASQSGNGSTATPYDDRGAGAAADPGFPTQPQTRTGGS